MARLIETGFFFFSIIKSFPKVCALNVRTLHTWLPQNPNIRTQQEPRAMTTEAPSDIDATVKLLETGNYVSDRSLATALHLALHKTPAILKVAGVGKTNSQSSF